MSIFISKGLDRGDGEMAYVNLSGWHRHVVPVSSALAPAARCVHSLAWRKANFHEQEQRRQWQPGVLARSKRHSFRSRLLRCAATAAVSSSSSLGEVPKKVVFLGTPEVAACALKVLLSKEECAKRVKRHGVEVSLVVSQPPAPAKRSAKKLVPSPVHALADQAGVQVWTPERARDAAFLENLRELAPDLCITVAYGQILPRSFLDIPKFGTLNIHPSLLPKYRGAAPVPRALQAGDEITGVSVLFTVFEMDAGPLVAQAVRKLEGDEHADELLVELLEQGMHMILDLLDDLFEGTLQSTDQDASAVSHAPKMTADDGRVTFTQNARMVHNQIRAFASNPGTFADFEIWEEGAALPEPVRLKILRTRVARAEGGFRLGVHDVVFDKSEKALRVVCDDGSELFVDMVTPVGKKAMDARSFWNGMRGRALKRARIGW
ncbi:Methionyl-tRNA formyltransferase [Porphyridium purpureum]|uniref:Methionyl-tRNA formyltransferase, mitochondrial n=1 Tax=Porphyridium purpureum TaxID=35688 RepID=A0A5J4Z6P5_PORPP|nr:Methionyl-tRNA formyltransferase [Porphyridium purpureum]|eukprot:POR7948..scf295_1